MFWCFRSGLPGRCRAQPERRQSRDHQPSQRSIVTGASASCDATIGALAANVELACGVHGSSLVGAVEVEYARREGDSNRVTATPFELGSSAHKSDVESVEPTDGSWSSHRDPKQRPSALDGTRLPSRERRWLWKIATNANTPFGHFRCGSPYVAGSTARSGPAGGHPTRFGACRSS